MSHTPEPWIHDKDENLIVNRNGQTIMAWQCRSIDFDAGTRDQNARRIVACVNACHGIATESLDRFTESHLPKNGFGLHRESELEAQRDALLAALKTLQKAFVVAVGDKSPFAKCALAPALKVIAKCEVNP